MIKSYVMIRTLVLLTLVVIGCQPAGTLAPAQSPTTAPTVTPVPPSSTPAAPLQTTPPSTLPPTSVGPSPSTAPLTPSAEKEYSNPDLGFAFRYPATWQLLARAADAPPGVTLRAPPVGAGPEPIIFAITVDMQPGVEASVQTIVDQQLQQVPSELQGGIKRRSVSVGGEPGEEVVGLPSQAGAVETFVLHSGRVYLIILQPYDESNTSLAPYLPQVRAVYDRVLATFRFS